MGHREFIQQIADKVAEGSRFCVNFEKQTLRLDGKLVDLSEVEYDKELVDTAYIESTLYSRYKEYKHSIPSERSESHRRSYFKALPEAELSDKDMLYGEQREVARCKLELSVLFAVISGNFKWHEEWGSWFYQYPYDKDFIILRSWIEPKQSEEQ